MYEWAEFRHFRYLIAILEKRGLRAAAEELHTAQPSLSVQARQFQENAGVCLYRKTKAGHIRVTEAGVAFIALAKYLLEVRDEVIEAIRAISRGEITSPVFVPLLMTRTFRAKFFHFLDVLVSFAMIRAVAAAFIFVWAGFMNGFIQQTFNSNYSMEMWLANLIPCTMVFLAFIINMLFIPSMTQAIFGGAAGMAGTAAQLAGSLAGGLFLKGAA